MKNNILIICCSVIGITAGAWYNVSHAKETKIVTAGLYKITSGSRELIRETKMSESDCIKRSKSIAGFKFEGGYLEVVCKVTKTFKKRVSFP